MLLRMAVRPSGLAGQRSYTSIPACFPVVDVRPALVVLSTCTANAIFCGILHETLPISHVLCYTVSHEGQCLLSGSVWCCDLTIPYVGSVLLLFYSLFLFLLSNMYCTPTYLEKGSRIYQFDKEWKKMLILKWKPITDSFIIRFTLVIGFTILYKDMIWQRLQSYIDKRWFNMLLY